MAITSWNAMGLDSRGAAKDLLLAGRYRSSISRAYYAAYCVVTHALAGGVTFGYGGNNPTHNELPKLIVSNLRGLTKSERHRLRKSVERLQSLRVEADYVPAAVFEKEDALAAVQELEKVFKILGVEE